MTITFVGAGAAVGGSNPTVPVPSGYIAGDLLVMLVVSTDNVIPTPSGWNKGSPSTLGIPNQFLWKIATSSESSVALSGVASSVTRAVMLAYRGNARFYDGLGGSGGATSATATPGLLTSSYTGSLGITLYATTNVAVTFGTSSSINIRSNNSGTASLYGLMVGDTLVPVGDYTGPAITLSTSTQ
jgi:ABC-type cobalamin transport system permease subunit